jgi:uncharacterized protein
LSTLVVAALSARMMAECAARDGCDVIALDVFGDADTRAASSHWYDIGLNIDGAARAQIDGDKLLAALRRLSLQGDVIGWVAGSGFEARPDLLAQGAALLPLIGTAPEAAARLRDPRRFFAALDALGIDHPPVRLVRDGADDIGWLRKDLHGSGGWHIHRIGQDAPRGLHAGQYLQREVPGASMSVTFVAGSGRPCLLGVNEQIVRPFGAHPHVWRGVVGPVRVSGTLRQRLQDIVAALAGAFALRGLASLDFLLQDDGRIDVLEINARPPASLALYRAWQPMAAHVRACLHGEQPTAARDGGDMAVHGIEIVFARRPVRAAAEPAHFAHAFAEQVHDLPSLGQGFAAGDPVCSVSACGADAASVHTLLRERREAVLTSLETSP